jgi:hypothetical protein
MRGRQRVDRGTVSNVGHVRSAGLILACALAVVGCTTEPASTTSTVTLATTTTSSTTTTTTVPDTTSTTSLDQRIAEVTEIVREVDFTFFSAIYEKDPEMLADALAVQDRYDNGLELMKDEDYFTQPPTREGIVVEVMEILIDRPDCLAVSYRGDVTAFRGSDAIGDLTTVYWPRPSDSRWRRAYRGDEWRAACDEFTRENGIP